MTSALQSVLDERKRQDAKWGQQNHDPFLYLTILGEEYGETCQAALEARFGSGSLDHLREEAVQTAAVALAIIECLDRKQWGWSTPVMKGV
jgi:NTP pyrophosphatase (non-canonical NTP hydrolase)